MTQSSKQIASRKKYLRRLRIVLEIFILSFVVIFIPIIVFLFSDAAGQCPADFSQEQVRQSDCVASTVGPQFSWPFILAIGSSVAALIIYIMRKLQQHSRSQ